MAADYNVGRLREKDRLSTRGRGARLSILVRAATEQGPGIGDSGAKEARAGGRGMGDGFPRSLAIHTTTPIAVS